MLGRSLGLTEDQMRYLTADEPPEGVYSEAEAAVIDGRRRQIGQLAVLRLERRVAAVDRVDELCQRHQRLWPVEFSNL